LKVVLTVGEPGVDVVEGGNEFILGGNFESSPEIGGEGWGCWGFVVEPLEGGKPLVFLRVSVGEHNQVEVVSVAGVEVFFCGVGLEAALGEEELFYFTALAAGMYAFVFEVDEGWSVEGSVAVAFLHVLFEVLVVFPLRGSWERAPGAERAVSTHWSGQQAMSASRAAGSREVRRVSLSSD
jgi:hypothetical protein